MTPDTGPRAGIRTEHSGPPKGRSCTPILQKSWAARHGLMLGSLDRGRCGKVTGSRSGPPGLGGRGRGSQTPMRRCDWATNDLAIRYHDEEWGVPVHDDRRLVRVPRSSKAPRRASVGTPSSSKREGYRRAFDRFDPAAVARYDGARRSSAARRPRHHPQPAEGRLGHRNARAFLEVQEEFGGFDAYIWRFVGGAPITNSWRTPRGGPGPDGRCPMR